VLLIGEMLKLGDSLRKRAMVLVVLGRTVLFTALLMLFHVVEETIHAAIKGLPVVESIMSIGGGSWFGMFVYAAIMFVMLIPLTAFRELSFVLGTDVMWKLLTSSERKV
jgi:D-alanyl-lipoteichoic acid acyltransferase DltB (MBOAT superfamily)